MARLTTQDRKVTDLRQKIADQKLHITEIENAPVPEDEAIEQFRQRLDKLAESGLEHLNRYARAHCWPAPTMGMLPELRTIERDGAPFLHSAGLQGVLASMNKTDLLESGITDIQEFYQNHTGLTVPATKRAELLARARKDLFALEAEEEKLVASSGLPRRPDADPAAVLEVEPGTPLPWNFRSTKASNLTVEAETARGALVGIREEIGQLQILLSRLESDTSAYREDSIPKRLAADLELARQDLDDLQQQLTQRQEMARSLNTIAARVNQYIVDHRTPRPANQGALMKPVNKSAANGAA